MRHLLNQTSGLSTKTGRSFQGDRDTMPPLWRKQFASWERRVDGTGRPKHQYSTINYSVLGLIVQTVAGRSYESYVQTKILDPLQMRNSFTSEAAAQRQASRPATTTGSAGLVRRISLQPGPRTGGLPDLQRRGYDPLPGLAARRRPYGGTSVLSPEGIAELHGPPFRPRRPTLRTAWAGSLVHPTESRRSTIRVRRSTSTPTSSWSREPDGSRRVDECGELARPLHQRSHGHGADGVTSLLQGQKPPSRPSNIPTFIVYAALFALLVLQARGIVRSVAVLRRGRVRARPDRPLVAHRAHAGAEPGLGAVRLRARAEAAGIVAPGDRRAGFPTSSTCWLPARWWRSSGPSSRRSGHTPSFAGRTPWRCQQPRPALTRSQPFRNEGVRGSNPRVGSLESPANAELPVLRAPIGRRLRMAHERPDWRMDPAMRPFMPPSTFTRPPAPASRRHPTPGRHGYAGPFRARSCPTCAGRFSGVHHRLRMSAMSIQCGCPARFRAR